MAKIHSIKPFPTGIDRDYFGAWLSGFVDGEGSFGLCQFYHGKQRYFISRADFFLGLRDDDAEVIRQIQSYWQCGSIHFSKQKTNVAGANPAVNFRVHRAVDLMKIIVPHFEKFPLMAKKSRDFEIWKLAVILQYEIKQRKKQAPSSGRGTMPKWSKEETALFGEYSQAIRDTRKYNSKNIEIPEKRAQKQTGIFLF